MTTEEAIKTIEVAMAEVEWNYPMDYAVAFEMAIAALRTQQEAKQNAPLTLDELRGMRGRWVWIVSPDTDLTVSAWAYVGKEKVFTYWEYEPDNLVGCVAYEICDYGKTWLAYQASICHGHKWFAGQKENRPG